MKLAVIPARGGSKRIPRKNIKPFFGKPVIAWAIETARASRCFDRIIVSTDDEEIAEIARHHGADTPFMRPAELADDHTGTLPVVAHAIRWQMKNSVSPQAVCCIYPTAVFLRPEHLTMGEQLLTESACNYAVSVTNYAFPIQRALRLNQAGRIEMLQPQFCDARSQDLPATYHDAAQFYWGRTDAWLAGRPLLSDGSIPVLLPNYLAQDIDTLDDWIHAELKFAHYLNLHE